MNGRRIVLMRRAAAWPALARDLFSAWQRPEAHLARNHRAQAWLIVEPLEVALVVFFPSLLDNKYVAWLRQALKDLGVI